MSHAVVDGMLEQSQAGDLRSPVAETLEMHLDIGLRHILRSIDLHAAGQLAMRQRGPTGIEP